MNHTEHPAKIPSHRTGFFAALSDSLRGGGSGAPSLRLIGLLALAIAAFLTLGASSAAAAEACPNETSRTGPSAALPDCRVYEAVTPVATEGHSQAYIPSAGTSYTDSNSEWGAGIITRRPFVVAPDGDAVAYPGDPAATGGGGSIGQGNGDQFFARRSSAGWSTLDIQPPRRAFEYLGFSSDLSIGIFSSSFPLAPSVPNPCDVLYSRTNADGVFHPAFTATETPGECGAPGQGFAGISADNTHLIFADDAALIPGAVSGQPNLYESVGGQLSLVNWLPNGELATNAAFGSPRTEGGEPHQQGLEGAISADGSTVFWTDGATGALYLRRNPTQSQSALDGEGHCTEPTAACTLQVSASGKTNGSAPGGADPDGPQPAHYLTATEDGSDVLFTSTEELTNDANTGPSPAIVRSGLDGTNVEAGFLPSGARWVATAAGHLYWANSSRGSIGRANLDGSEPDQSFINGVSNPQGLAVDGSHIYWSSDVGGEEAGSIGRANLDGSEPDQSFISGASNPRGLAVDGSHVYWTNSSTRTIGRANLDGSEPEQSFIAAGNDPQGLAVDGTHIYWAQHKRPEEGEQLIGRANLDGSEVQLGFIASAGNPDGLAVDGSHIYWTNPAEGTVARANLDGSEPDQSFITGVAGPKGVAVDATHIYWAGNAGDTEADLYRYQPASPPGARLTDLLPGVNVKGILGTSADGSDIYFVSGKKLATNSNSTGEVAVPGSCEQACNLYLLRTSAAPRFIASLSPRDNTAIAPFDKEGEGFESGAWQAAPGYRTAEVTPDGESLIFLSSRSLTGYPNEGLTEVYSYDATADLLSCVSCNPSGEAPVATEYDTRRVRLGAWFPISKTSFPGDTHQVRGVSTDGSRIFFESAQPLVPSDTNGWADVYEWERQGTGSCHQPKGCVYLITAGTDRAGSELLGTDSSGENAFLLTRSQLVPDDRNENVDVYDARVNGVAPPAEALPCQGESCREAIQIPPNPPSPATPGFVGPGNPPAPRPCRKGKFRKHGKCVRKQRKQKHHRTHKIAHRAASHNRGGSK